MFSPDTFRLVFHALLIVRLIYSCQDPLWYFLLQNVHSDGGISRDFGAKRIPTSFATLGNSVPFVKTTVCEELLLNRFKKKKWFYQYIWLILSVIYFCNSHIYIWFHHFISPSLSTSPSILDSTYLSLVLKSNWRTLKAAEQGVFKYVCPQPFFKALCHQ